MQKPFVTRWKGVKIIAVLHLNDEVGWKIEKEKNPGWIQITFRYKNIQ